MAEIKKILDKIEIKHGLLKVKDIKSYLPQPRESMVIIDEDGEEFKTKMHSVTPRIDGLTKLIRKHNAKVRDQVMIRVDENQIGIAKVKFESNLIISSKNEEASVFHDTEEDLLITPSLESMLEDFIINNLNKLDPNLSLYYDEEGVSGQQYYTEVGVIDLLCTDSNKDFVIIELKKGRESDRVVGQISRYMGWVQEKLAGTKKVKGIIILHKPTSTYVKDEKLHYAVLANPNIELRYYGISLNFFDKEQRF